MREATGVWGMVGMGMLSLACGMLSEGKWQLDSLKVSRSQLERDNYYRKVRFDSWLQLASDLKIRGENDGIPRSRMKPLDGVVQVIVGGVAEMCDA
eukprot:768263-Hanusia_phi.AAC.3